MSDSCLVHHRTLNKIPKPADASENNFMFYKKCPSIQPSFYKAERVGITRGSTFLKIFSGRQAATPTNIFNYETIILDFPAYPGKFPLTTL